MKRLILASILLLPVLSFAQKKSELDNIDYEAIGAAADSIVEEGKRLYKLEMASWYGTDLFLENVKDRTKMAGYFSYMNEKTPTCVFFSRGEAPVILGTIMFDSSYNVKTATVDMEERPMTRHETEYYRLRTAAMEVVNGGDTLFKTYEKTSLNLIPLIHEGKRRVYILTGPTEQGVVIFGNDYLLEFDGNEKLLSRRKLHTNIIIVEYGQKNGSGGEAVTSMHTHLPGTGDFHTATDVCTLLLYGKYTGWKQHNVVSADFYTIWDLDRKDLTPITRDAMKKIMEHQESKKKNK